jgi:hypothetical protein
MEGDYEAAGRALDEAAADGEAVAVVGYYRRLIAADR